MTKNPLVKQKPFIYLLAISLSLFVLQRDLDSCSVTTSETIGPALRKGKIVGFRIYSFPKKSFLNYLGIKKNDLITEVNGEKVFRFLGNEKAYEELKSNFKKNRHLKLKILRKKSTFTIEFVLNPKNISNIKNPPCSGYEIDQSIPKKEMFDFYEMKKIE
ncbi:MAG: hypothetical protein KBF93_18570 [Leptospiraceae bacterium]|nr:hypothetical protein [Leptospiraceae bacterium]